MVGKVNGFSQIRLIDVCREFLRYEPAAFRSLWQGDSESIYDALIRYETGGEPYREILKLVLFAVAEDFFESGGQSGALAKKLEAERRLTLDEELDVVYLKIDIRRLLNMEVGELAFSRFVSGAPFAGTVEVEVAI